MDYYYYSQTINWRRIKGFQNQFTGGLSFILFAQDIEIQIEVHIVKWAPIEQKLGRDFLNHRRILNQRMVRNGKGGGANT